ncbi:MAG: DUF1846 domain-containing protein [Clostridia bacterium]|nr:DUF1846 domain-containing protein [Clostridia bacterium]
MNRIGFDNSRYIELQSERIRERIRSFGGKLYLEFGGKLFDDYHASRVLPGFCPDSKIKMLLSMKDNAETIVVVSAPSIEQNKIRGDLGITYDMDALRLIDAFNEIGIKVSGVVLTQYMRQAAADSFIKRLNNLGVKVYKHYQIDGYPSNVAKIVSDEGLGKNEYVETTKPLIVVTAPGPGSGKMATCLSQLYHDHKRGIKAGYAKYETFPVWNLPITHPVNLAYEAATLDLSDVNMIDPYYLESTGVTAINYNRDIEVYPVLRATFERIYGYCPYKSPTDMGVNMAGYCIVNEEAVAQASKMEIVRRYYDCLCRRRNGTASGDEVYQAELLMNKAGIDVGFRKVVEPALKKAEATGEPATAIELPNGTIVTGKTSKLMGCSASALLNALKKLGGIDDSYLLLPPEVIEPIQKLKVDNLGNHNPRLHADEILIALAIAATSDPRAALAMEQLPKLNECEAHTTVIVSQLDKNIYRKLGLNLTCEPNYSTKKLYHKS